MKKGKEGKRTSVQVFESTKKALDKLGKKGETYDDIIRRLLGKPDK